MSIAIVCMVNHTAVKMMRDAHLSSSSSSSGEGNLTTTPPGEWQRNESDDAIEKLRSHCAGNDFGSGSNMSRVMVIISSYPHMPIGKV